MLIMVFNVRLSVHTPTPVIHPLLQRRFASFLALVLILSSSFTAVFSLSTQVSNAAFTQCSDGIDNDSNGKVDYPQDPQCVSLEDDYEGVSLTGNFITLTDGHESVAPGGAVVYVITLKQQRSDARTVNLQLHLPFQSNIVSASDGGIVSSDLVTWTNVSVYKNVTRVLQVHANVNPDAAPGKYLVAKALVEGDQATDTTLVENYTGASSTDAFKVSLSDGREFVRPGENLTYSVRVRNTSSETVKNDVRLNIPYETYYVSNSDGGRHDSYSIVWSNVSFEAGVEKIFTGTVQVDPQAHDRGAIRARASVGSANAADQTVVRVGIPYNSITTTLSDGRQTAEKGQTLTYQLKVTNTDSSFVGTNIAVDAGLPLYGEFVSATDNGYFDGSNIRWLVMNIAPKETRLLTFTVRVRPDAPENAVLTASAVADGITGSISRDTTKVVSESTEIGQFERGSSIMFRKTADRQEAFPGGSIRYTLSIRNTLDHTISDAAIYDRFNGRYLSIESYDHPENLVSQGDGSMTWKVPVLQPGESWQTSYVLSVAEDTAAGVDLTNVATLRGSDLDNVSLTEKVQTVTAGVMKDFPQTGGTMDAALAMLLGLAALGAASMQKKLVNIRI